MLQKYSKHFSSSIASYLGVGVFSLICFLIWYFPVFIHRLIFYSADQFPGFLTGQQYWFDTFKRTGNFPLWNPYVDLGTSFLYNPMRGIFYPPNYFQLWMTPLSYFQTTWLIHLIVFTLGLYRWAKNAKAPKNIAYLLPILMGTSAFINSFAGNCMVYLFAVTWSAWCLSEIELIDTKKFSFLKLALFWSLLVSSGDPFCIFLTACAIAAFMIQKKKFRTLIYFLSLSALLAILVFGHAFLILPYTSRKSGLLSYESLSFSFHPLRLITLFSPYFFGQPSQHNFDLTGLVNDSPYTARFLFDTFFFSTPLVILFSLGFKNGFKEKKYLPIALFLFGLLLAFGKWGLLSLFHYFPPFSYLRFPEKMTWVTSLFLFSIALRQSDKWLEELKGNKMVLILLGLAVGLPLLSQSNEYFISTFAFILLLGFIAHQKKIISSQVFTFTFLFCGLTQNYFASAPLRITSSDGLENLSEAGKEILETIPRDSLKRIEMSPSFFDEGLPHEHLLWGSNMIHQRASLLGYESTNTRFNEEIKTLLYGENYQSGRAKERMLSPSEMQTLIYLTNLNLVGVKNDRPLASLIPSVDNNTGIYQVRKKTGNMSFLEPKNLPSSAWYFPKLELWNGENETTQMHWPPKVNLFNPFIKGLQTHIPNYSANTNECNNPSVTAMPISESAIYKINEDHWMLDFPVPCDGWIFISQNLFPGWQLHDLQKEEKPLFQLNDNFLGFKVKAGVFKGDLTFKPWQALFRKLSFSKL